MLSAISSSFAVNSYYSATQSGEAGVRPANSATQQTAGQSNQPTPDKTSEVASDKETGESTARGTASEKSPTEERADEREVTRLQTVDRTVRAHEAAHLAAAQGLAVSGASFGYETGPDGKRYAVSGEVNIDTSRGRTPEETLAKAGRIRRAAMAPADPSAQDHAVAAMADRMASDARLELARSQIASYTRDTTSQVGRQVDVSA